MIGGDARVFPFSLGTLNATLLPRFKGSCFWVRAWIAWFTGRAGRTTIKFAALAAAAPPAVAPATFDIALGVGVDCRTVEDSRTRFGRLSAT